LLCWIGTRKLGIDGLHVYMDDFYGWDFADKLVFFHHRLRPARQVQLLILWDFISCPYEDKKQDHDELLKIIGFWVDANGGSISLSPDSIEEIISHVNTFLATSDRKPRLRIWQQLSGHLNWLLNVIPWARPALCEMYRKMSGKSHSHSPIYINAAVVEDLTWISQVIPDAIGVRFVDSLHWHDHEADMIIWTDASLKLALGFAFSNRGFVYQLKPPVVKPGNPPPDIFFLELIAILSAIHYAANLIHPPKRILIHTDSLDSVAVLSSLAAKTELHNAPLRAISQIILLTGIDLRVQHIEGKLNIHADLLSRMLLSEYKRLFPSDRVDMFEPPRELL
ncbi:hypothetical protein CPB83DRAFT_752245, partial [Crepidotus variabilis]